MSYARPPEDFDSVVMALMTAIEAKDLKIRRHSERVARFCLQIAEAIGMDDEQRMRLHFGSLLHDIGNIGMPDSILQKPTGLTDWEFDEMKLHPIIGEQICKPLRCTDWLRLLIRNHHEKLDGSGYPDGLTAAEIDLPLRILSLVDVYDTLRSERAYRQAFGHEEALTIVRDEVGRGWWDAQVVDLLPRLDVTEDDFAPV